MAQKMVEHGGLPIFWSGTVAAPGTSETFTTPAGFYPDHVMVFQKTTTTPSIFEWHRGVNTNPGATVYADDIDGASFNINTYVTDSTGITVASGSIALGAAICVTDVQTTVLAWRYSA